MPDAIYAVTKGVLNKLFEEFLNPPAEASMFFEFTRHIDAKVYVIPHLYSLFRDQLHHDEEAFAHANSLMEDGGIVMGNATFGDDIKDVTFLAHMLKLNNPGKPVIIVKTSSEQIDMSMKSLETILLNFPESKSGVQIFNLEEIEPVIRYVDPEFITLWKGSNA